MAIEINAIMAGILLSLFAGLATTLGALISLFIKRTDNKLLAIALGFSAGVMINVSFVEMLANSISHVGFIAANLIFFAGIVFAYFIDIMVPHEYIAECLPADADPRSKMLARAGIMTAIGITIHNVAEGMAVFVGAIHSIGVGVILAVAIAVHNIPEGISVSMPIYCATNDRKRAFWYSFFSGLAEPIGAIVAGLLLLPVLTPALVNGLLAFVAGIMIYISFDELLPAAHKYGEEHVVAGGLIIGMMVMSATLIFLR